MSQNIFVNLYTRIKDILLYKTPTESHRFVLVEGEDDAWEKTASSPAVSPHEEQKPAFETLISFSHRLETLVQKKSMPFKLGNGIVLL